MERYKIELNHTPETEVKTYSGEVEVDGNKFHFYLTDNDNGSDHDIDFMGTDIDSELFDYEIEELKVLIRNKYQNEF